MKNFDKTSTKVPKLGLRSMVQKIKTLFSKQKHFLEVLIIVSYTRILSQHYELMGVHVFSRQEYLISLNHCTWWVLFLYYLTHHGAITCKKERKIRGGPNENGQNWWIELERLEQNIFQSSVWFFFSRTTFHLLRQGATSASLFKTRYVKIFLDLRPFWN